MVRAACLLVLWWSACAPGSVRTAAPQPVRPAQTTPPVRQEAQARAPTLEELQARLLRDDPRYPHWGNAMHEANRRWLEALRPRGPLPADAVCRFKSVAHPLIALHVAGLLNLNLDRWFDESPSSHFDPACAAAAEGAAADCARPETSSFAWNIVCAPPVGEDPDFADALASDESRRRAAMQAAVAQCNRWRTLAARCAQGTPAAYEDLDLVETSLRTDVELFRSGGFGMYYFGGSDTDPELTGHLTLGMICELVGGDVKACEKSRPDP